MYTNHEFCVHENRTLHEGPAVPLRARVLQRLRVAAGLALGRWRQRARLRRDLERLDARQLHDIGLSRDRLEAEARKPFWRP